MGFQNSNAHHSVTMNWESDAITLRIYEKIQMEREREHFCYKRNSYSVLTVDKKMENFIRAKFEHYNTGRTPQKALKNVLHFRSQGPVIQVF